MRLFLSDAQAISMWHTGSFSVIQTVSLCDTQVASLSLTHRLILTQVVSLCDIQAVSLLGSFSLWPSGSSSLWHTGGFTLQSSGLCQNFSHSLYSHSFPRGFLLAIVKLLSLSRSISAEFCGHISHFVFTFTQKICVQLLLTQSLDSSLDGPGFIQ